MRSDQGVNGRYFDQINTLRLLAVSLVLAEHWLYPIVRSIGLQGSYGVWIFFAISGFLITGILLDYRASIDAREITLGHAIKTFYARRFLRIFPAYYLFLAVALALGPAAAAAGIWWHMAYASNVYFLQLGHFASLGHLWSLAVEEQFYLVWPFVVLLLPLRALPPLLIACVVAAPLFRAASFHFGWGLAGYVLPMACLDTLGLGALLALARRRTDGRAQALLVACGAVGMVAVPFAGFAPAWFQAIVSPLVVGLAGVFMIDRCVRGVGGRFGRVLSFRPFLYLGGISYGLYLFQSLPAWLIPAYIGIGTPGGSVAMLASAAARMLALVALASLSWYVWELPLNRLKRHFVIAPRVPSPQAGFYRPGRRLAVADE